MSPLARTDEALRLFQALSDANRLRLLGLLAIHPHSVEELSAVLRLRPATVSHHLSRLTQAGLVEARAESYYSVYALASTSLEARARRFLTRRALRHRTADLDLEAFDLQVLREYTRRDGRLKSLPAQPRKRLAVLRRLALAFRPGRRYREADVHRALRKFYDDPVTLRGELVSAGLLQPQAEFYVRRGVSPPSDRRS
jgi:biotin operon repressor